MAEVVTAVPTPNVVGAMKGGGTGVQLLDATVVYAIVVYMLPG